MIAVLLSLLIPACGAVNTNPPPKTCVADCWFVNTNPPPKRPATSIPANNIPAVEQRGQYQPHP